jgi:ATP-binding cassette subfamily C protein CydC
LLKFYPPSQGRLTLDGTPLSQLSGESVRERIAVVAQQNHLFNTTIRENLLLAKSDADQAELEQACRIAEIHDFVQAQPKGYETQVGETGIRLSGGQVRRIAIARAVLKGARILVLDEPTEGLDPQTARQVLENIGAWLGERSLLLITHRLQGLAAMDEILVMESGRIRERGKHRQLLKQGGRYSRLHALNRLLDA